MRPPKAFEHQKIPIVSFRHDANNFDLDIVELASIQKRAKELSPPPDRPHRVTFNMLILIEHGKGRHLVDFEKISFKSNSVLFLNQGQVQAFDFTEELQGKAILFTESFIETLQANMRIPFMLGIVHAEPHIVLKGTLKRSVSRLLEELSIEIKRETPDTTISMSLFSALLLMLVRDRENPARDLRGNDAQRFMSFLHLIEQHYTKSRDASFYADALNMTYKTLNVLCKRATGETAKYHIDQYVVLEAKRRLAIEQHDIATLSYSLGFDEPTNFTKFFKRHTGLTPKQFQ